MIYDKILKIIYIGKTNESIKYFKSLVEENETYKLVDCYLFTDNYKQAIIDNDVDCVVIDLNIDDCQDIKFMRYIKTLDMYVIAFGVSDVYYYIKNKINIDLPYIDFLYNNSNSVKINSFFSIMANNKVEFNVSEFFDCYVNDSPVVFDDEDLERFISFLTCRRKRIVNYEEIVETLYPKLKSDVKRWILYHSICCKFYDFLKEINMSYLFDYNQERCLFNYHLVSSDFYYEIETGTKEFNFNYINTIDPDFTLLLEQDLENRKLQAALDFDELHFEEEIYIPLLDEDKDDDFNIVEEKKISTFEESFLDKAMKKK
ncbi:MAG: hypothetical protein IJS58_03285 [Bacilli bacterium]|nr:hypothetical protein [Bacilli bacterium]